MNTLGVLITTFILSVSCDDFNLILLHNNDMHSRFQETAINSAKCKTKDLGTRNCLGGFARTAHEVRRHRQRANEGTGPPVVFLNAGDTYIGTEWFSYFKWKICVDFIEALKPDAMSLGNHEFDSGVDGLVPFVNALVNITPILAANLDLTDVPELNNLKKSVILEVAGRKIGVIGHLTEETKIISQPGKTKFLDVVKSVREESERLVGEGVDILIALGHSGYDLDQEIAAQVEHIDVVVGGHTNTFLWNGAQPSIEPIEDPYPKIVTQKSGKRVPVVQAYAYTKYLGRLNLTFDENGDLKHFVGQPILMDASIPQDEDVLQILEVYKPQVEQLNAQIVGRTRVLLDGNAAHCRFVECNFGNYVADSMVYYVASEYAGKNWTNTPIGIVNGGGLRNSINPTNEISYGDLLSVLPYDNRILQMTLTGEDLIKTLEIGIRGNGETSNGEFLQVSGLKVVYDRSKKAFSRVVSVKVRCSDCAVPKYEQIDPKGLYRIVTTSFIAEGGDGHTILRDNGKNVQSENLNDLSILRWYMQQQKLIYPQIEERIEFNNESTQSGSYKMKPNIFVIVLIFCLAFW